MLFDYKKSILLERCIENLLSMKKNDVLLDLINAKSKSVEFVCIYIAELIISMEKSKFLEARKIYKNNSKYIKSYSYELDIAFNLMLERKYIEARKCIFDLLSIHSDDIYLFYLCHMLEFNSSLTRDMMQSLSLVKIKKTSKFYPYFKGIQSFILNENRFYKNAYIAAKESLKFNKLDIYAIHALCHYYHDTSKHREGKEFMEQMYDLWKNNYSMRIHLFWHYALFLIYTNEIGDKIENIFCNIRSKNIENGLEDLDISSFIFRLFMLNDMNVDFLKSELANIVDNWNNENLGFYFFNDFHASLVFSMANKFDLLDMVIKKSKYSFPRMYYKEKVALLRSLEFICLGKYKDVVNILEVFIKKDVYSFMGGSNAQRSIIFDIFNKAKMEVENETR